MSQDRLSRRQALTLAGGFAASNWLAAAFDATAAPLVYALQPIPLADGVWMIAGAQEAISMSNGGAIANVAILDSRDGAIVIDTGPSKRYGEALELLARKLTGKPVVRAFITHFHPDHALGNQAFTADALATTADVRKGLEQMGDDFASAMYRTAGDWMRGTEVVLPKTTVAKGVEEIGGRRLHLIPLSGHTDSDLVILDEKSGLVFSGDIVFLDRAPTTPHADLPHWRTSLDALSQIPHAKLMPGHGPAENGARGIAQTRDWLAAIEEVILRSFDRGLDITEAAAEPLPAWTQNIALARYEFERSVMHLYPKLEAVSWPRVDRKS